ncbi:LamG-like jellyroll fold domain-containing protein [Calycomorphotria hydatis]|uniref:FecR protein n=1 Tax=Calycomorphotria hydatis TaxID=2528027 RepID=A0A517TE82_9PLAN|nr:LamG-like jellyroll fold domain-containing protein [Calycomorphotria hydatis]QDT66676.1 FecR protein [Calycomorphotria hydatis]
MKLTTEELESLLMDWECGSLDDQGVERLREILKDSSEAREQFARFQLISAALQQESETGVAPQFAEKESDFRTLNHSRMNWHYQSSWLIGALSLTVCVLAGWIVFSQPAVKNQGEGLQVDVDSPTERDPSTEATATGVALVTRLVDVTWNDDQQAVHVGDALPTGRFSIASGHAQVEFFCGATVVIEGPAELDLQSAMSAKVMQGRLRANVPPAARGFSLEADDFKVVDLGTEFGLTVSPEESNVQVFDGEVEVFPTSADKKLLTTGQAVVMTKAGDYQQAASNPDAFVDIARLEQRERERRMATYEHWKTESLKLRQNPELIAYYSFDTLGDWERRLVCTKEPVDSELDGAIVGANEVDGRWNQKRALEFKQPADRVRVQIPGEFGSLTFSCWVKIDSLDRWYNSLFLTDGYDKGEPHWQILDTGELYFSVRPVDRGEEGPRDFKALSPPFWNPTLNGKWIHLAVTCDLTSNEIVHYLNGEVLSRHLVPAEQMPDTTRIGTASIGNWAMPTMPNSKFAIRNLNGCMDELAIFATVLSADEIEELYNNGRP